MFSIYSFLWCRMQLSVTCWSITNLNKLTRDHDIKHTTPCKQVTWISWVGCLCVQGASHQCLLQFWTQNHAEIWAMPLWSNLHCTQFLPGFLNEVFPHQIRENRPPCPYFTKTKLHCCESVKSKSSRWYTHILYRNLGWTSRQQYSDNAGNGVRAKLHLYITCHIIVTSSFLFLLVSCYY